MQDRVIVVFNTYLLLTRMMTLMAHLSLSANAVARVFCATSRKHALRRFEEGAGHAGGAWKGIARFPLRMAASVRAIIGRLAA